MLLVSSLMMLLAMPATALAAPAPAPPFTECPHVGSATSCAVLIVFNADGTTTLLNDPSVTPFDTPPVEDTLVGVLNNTGVTISNVVISSGLAIFGFDNDGVCNVSSFRPSGCPFGSTGYEGPNTSFSSINGARTSGTVNFTGGLVNGASAYFGLEERVTAANITIPVAKLTYTGATSQDFNDPAALSATLVDAATSAPLVGATITFKLDGQAPCTGITDASGKATCSVTPNEAAGGYSLVVSFPGNAFYLPVTTTVPFTVTREETALSYNGATTSDFNDAATVSATLTEDGAAPIAGVTLSFTLDGQAPCTGTTDATGKASCSITPNEAAGTYTLTASFAGNGFYLPASATPNFVVTKEETTLSYTGDTLIANGGTATLSGVLKEDGTTPIAGRTVSFTLGTGASAQSCNGTTNASGAASCTVSPVSQPLGPGTVAASFAGDGFYLPASASANTLLFAFLAQGSFVVGDQSDTGAVNFWGAQWANNNSLSGGAAPNSFKGFANTTSTPPACGQTWTTDPGNSSGPPASIPSYMAVIVSSSISKSGSTISGNTPEIVVVKTDPGYAPNPGHAGTGTVVAVFCH